MERAIPLSIRRIAETRSRVGRAWRPLVVGLALFGAFAALLAYVQLGASALADNDGYYHMKMGWLMRQQGLRPDFVWLPLSILSRAQFYDHHMLYHAYLALFTGDGSAASMLWGAKAASIVMPSLSFVAIWWLLRGQQVPWAPLWALGLCAVSEAFLYRMSQPRAQSAALLVLALGLHWLLQRRYRRLLPLGFVFVWLYNAFPLLLVLAVAYVAATLLTERSVAWGALLFPVGGIVLGLLVNPYFPQNLAFIVSHIGPKLAAPTTTVGNEWYPYETWTLVQNSGVALALWLLGVFAIGWRGRRFDRAQLTAFLLSVAFGYLLLRSRRFVEYFPPFALIFAALAASPLLAEWYGAARRGITRHALGVALALVIAGALALTLPEARALMARSRPADTFQGASGWLRASTPAGSMVFQTDWDDFPRLFFYNSHNVYTVGLDPTYLELYDRELYDLWVDITRGTVEHPSLPIRERFGAMYVVSDLDHEAFMRRAAADLHMREVYRDASAVVYQIQE